MAPYGSPDIMGHLREKGGLGLAGHNGLVQGVPGAVIVDGNLLEQTADGAVPRDRQGVIYLLAHVQKDRGPGGALQSGGKGLGFRGCQALKKSFGVKGGGGAVMIDKGMGAAGEGHDRQWGGVPLGEGLVFGRQRASILSL